MEEKQEREEVLKEEHNWYQKFSTIDLIAILVLLVIGSGLVIVGEVFGWAVLFLMVVKILQQVRQ